MHIRGYMVSDEIAVSTGFPKHAVLRALRLYGPKPDARYGNVVLWKASRLPAIRETMAKIRGYNKMVLSPTADVALAAD